MGQALLNRRETLELSGVSERRLEREVEAGVIAPVRDMPLRFQVEAVDAMVLFVLGSLKVPLPLELKRTLRARLHDNWPRLAARWREAGQSEHDDLRTALELILSPNLLLRIDDDWLERFAVADDYAHFRAEDIESDPEVRGGEPVVRGTRIPVRTLAALLDQGESLEALREDYPGVPERALRFAQLWDRANPRRGRPRRALAD